MSDLGDSFTFTANELPPDSKIGGANGSTEMPPAPKQSSKRDTEFIVKGLEQFYHNGGMFLSLVSPADGVTVASNAHELAESWRDVLNQNVDLRKRMLQMLESGAWSSVIVAHLMVAIAIMGNHGVTLEHLIKRRQDKSMDGEETLRERERA